MNEDFKEKDDFENSVRNTGNATPPPIIPTNPINNRKGGGFKMAIIILLVMLIVAIGVLVAYMIIRDNNSQPTVTDETTIIVDTVKVIDTVKVEKTELPASATETISKPDKKDPNKYVGNIGKYKVEGYIYFKGDRVKGKYRYIRQNGAGGWLDLNGERSPDGSYTISEQTYNGNICGYWKCNVQGDKIIGNMTNSNGEEYTVDLSRE